MALYIRFFLIGFFILWAPFTKADWMNLTGAETAQNIVEIYVLDDHVKVRLEVYIGDLDKFEELIPDEWFKDSAGKRPSLEQRMQAFANQRLQFITGEGVTLPAKLVLAEARQRVDRQSAYAGMINPLTRRRVQESPADKSSSSNHLRACSLPATENSAVNSALSAPLRTQPASERSPSNNPRASTRIDLPAPVSPVIAVNPSRISRSSVGTMAKLRIWR